VSVKSTTVFSFYKVRLTSQSTCSQPKHTPNPGARNTTFVQFPERGGRRRPVQFLEGPERPSACHT
jgi:hypothetical protein